MDISVEVYENRNTVEDYTGQDNFISSLHIEDFMEPLKEVEKYKQLLANLLMPDFVEPYVEPKVTN